MCSRGELLLAGMSWSWGERAAKERPDNHPPWNERGVLWGTRTLRF